MLPANLFPAAFDRNQTPISADAYRDGASFVTIDSPTGDSISSPMVWKRYAPTIHNIPAFPAASRRRATADTRPSTQAPPTLARPLSPAPAPAPPPPPPAPPGGRRPPAQTRRRPPSPPPGTGWWETHPGKTDSPHVVTPSPP